MENRNNQNSNEVDRVHKVYVDSRDKGEIYTIERKIRAFSRSQQIPMTIKVRGNYVHINPPVACSIVERLVDKCHNPNRYILCKTKLMEEAQENGS